MTFGVSLILIAVGAILTWGVNKEVEGLDISVVGVILMIVGLVGFILSMLFWSQWSPVYQRRRSTYVEGAPARRPGYARADSAPRREVVIEEEVPPAGPPAGPPPPP